MILIVNLLATVVYLAIGIGSAKSLKKTYREFRSGQKKWADIRVRATVLVFFIFFSVVGLAQIAAG